MTSSLVSAFQRRLGTYGVRLQLSTTTKYLALIEALVVIPSGADDNSLFDFAHDAPMTLHRVFRRSQSRVAVELGAHKKLCVEGCLAAGVLIAKKALYLVEVKQLPKLVVLYMWFFAGEDYEKVG